MHNKLTIVRGTTNILGIVVNDDSGAVYELVEGEKIVFGVKCDTDDENFMILKTATYSADDGVYVVTLIPDDTIDLKCGNYVYDVALESSANFYNIIEPSPFIIEPNVTRRGCMS